MPKTTKVPHLEMTSGDNDSFIVTLRGISLVGADFFRIRMNRPSPSVPLEKDGVAVDLANGRFSITFDSGTDLVEGPRQEVDVKWSIASVVLTSKNHLLISVKAAV